MTDQVTAELARYGITIGFEPGGAIELIGRNGVSCGYSARGFCPVISLGAPEGAVYVRLRADVSQNYGLIPGSSNIGEMILHG
jgi:hypothetical protein